MRLVTLSLALALVSVTRGAAGQQPAAAPATVRVSGDVLQPIVLSAADLRSMPRLTVRAAEHDRPPVTYEGVPLSAVLERAGFTFGAALRGALLATSVVIDAADGYRATLAIAELDSAFSARRVILADRADGAPLIAASGPFRIIISDEHRPARWVRQVTGIRVITAPAPR